MQQSPQKLKWLLTGALALGAIVASVHPASAQSVTFAQFNEVTTNKPFTFTNNGSGSTFSATTNVKLTFTNLMGIASSPLSNGTYNALLTLTATTGANPTVGAGTTLNPYLQPLTTFSLKLTSQGNAGITNGSLFLGVSNNDGVNSTLYGLAGRNNSNPLVGQDTNAGDIVFFTSDYLNFSNTVSRDFGLSSSGTQSTLRNSTMVSGLRRDTNNYLASFVADFTGTFASDPAPLIRNPVPEPGAVVGLAMLGTSVCGLMVRARRRTGKSSGTPAAA